MSPLFEVAGCATSAPILDTGRTAIGPWNTVISVPTFFEFATTVLALSFTKCIQQTPL